FMREAVKHAHELSVAALVSKWVQQGCPAPEPPEPPEPLVPLVMTATPEGLDAAAAAQPTLATETEPPWPLAIELERVQGLIQERTRLLERLCELSGGHQPLPRRDAASGRLYTVCERCDAQLYLRVPEQGEAWVN